MADVLTFKGWLSPGFGETTWRLDDETLAWSGGRGNDSTNPYADGPGDGTTPLARIRGLRVFSVREARFLGATTRQASVTCTVLPASGPEVMFCSVAYSGAGRGEDRRQSFAPFLAALAERAVKLNPALQLSSGMRSWELGIYVATLVMLLLFAGAVTSMTLAQLDGRSVNPGLFALTAGLTLFALTSVVGVSRILIRGWPRPVGLEAFYI